MLGAENLGTIGLLALNITIVIMVNNLFGGGSLVYLVPRYSFKTIRSISYSWAFVAALIVYIVFYIFKIEPQEYLIHVLILSVILSLSVVNQNLLLGKERINAYNILSFFQYSILLASICVWYFLMDKMEVESYIISLYISWSFILLLGFWFVFREKDEQKEKNGFVLVIREMFKFGFYTQLASLAQFFNYRLAYFFIESRIGRAGVGLFDIGNKISDGVWLFSRSLSLVQYSKISNTDDAEKNRILTIQLLKLSLTLCLLICLVLVLIPESLYLSVFGAEYAGIYRIIVILIPGIIAVSLNMIFAHYFAGMGRYRINTIGSGIGLVVIVALCLLLIPLYQLEGAALAATLTYISTFIFNIVVFSVISKTKLKDIRPRISDLKDFVRIVKSLRSAKD